MVKESDAIADTERPEPAADAACSAHGEAVQLERAPADGFASDDGSDPDAPAPGLTAEGWKASAPKVVGNAAQRAGIDVGQHGLEVWRGSDAAGAQFVMLQLGPCMAPLSPALAREVAEGLIRCATDVETASKAGVS